MTEIHNEIEELYAKAIINFIFEKKTCQSWDYMYFLALKWLWSIKISSKGVYLEEVSEDKYSIKKNKHPSRFLRALC